jgi:hypothetical protein
VLAYLDDERIHQHEGKARAAQIASIPDFDERVEPFAQVRDGRHGEFAATQLLGDAGHLARGDAVDHHLHQGKNQGLFAALVARKEVGGEAALAHLGHPQGQGAHACGELARLVAVAIALPLLGLLVALRLQLLTHLRLKHLVEDALQEVGELVIATEEALQRLFI